MSQDIFGQESKILSEAKALISEGNISLEAYAEIVSNYGKLLRTTKKIIKLSDKNEDKLNELKREALESSAKLQSISSQLSKFLSPQLYDSIFSGSRAGTRATRRKKLTVFFSDLCGFTDFVESMESEDVTSVLNLYLETMTNIALNYGATIDKYIGDGIMLFFGDPETKGIREDALSCVRMAMEMQRELEGLSEEWSQFGLKEPLQMRIGIDTGFATVGNFGSESRLDYTAIGSAVNRASRLETAAENGSIYISEDTYNLIDESIEAAALPPLSLKGIGDFKARKVIGELDSKSIALNLGKRTISLVPEKMSESELQSLQASLASALQQLDKYTD